MDVSIIVPSIVPKGPQSQVPLASLLPLQTSPTLIIWIWVFPKFNQWAHEKMVNDSYIQQILKNSSLLTLQCPLAESDKCEWPLVHKETEWPLSPPLIISLLKAVDVGAEGRKRHGGRGESISINKQNIYFLCVSCTHLSKISVDVLSLQKVLYQVASCSLLTMYVSALYTPDLVAESCLFLATALGLAPFDWFGVGSHLSVF